MLWSAILLLALHFSALVLARKPLPQLSFSGPLTLEPYPHLRPLHFSQDGTFKLLIISDTHLLDDQNVHGNASNLNKASADAVTSYLKMEKPNFVVHLGDLISGERAHNQSEVVGAVRQILDPLKKAGVPFATAKGNHDNDKYSTHGLITDIERKYFSHLSYTRKALPGIGGGDTGTDNYWVPIYGSKEMLKKEDRPSLILWFFDSRSGKELLSRGGAQIDDWVDYSVAGWIKSEVKRMEDDSSLAALCSHTPHASYQTQMHEPYSSLVGGVHDETSANYTKSRRVYKGLNDDRPVASQGGENDHVPYDGQDKIFIEAFMHSAAGKARVHGVVSGHDHGNDWCAPGSLKTAVHQVVPLCFAKHSGFGGYDDDRWNHGVRVFNFNLRNVSQSVQTYIRFLTGEMRYTTRLSDRWAKIINV